MSEHVQVCVHVCVSMGVSVHLCVCLWEDGLGSPGGAAAMLPPSLMLLAVQVLSACHF